MPRPLLLSAFAIALPACLVFPDDCFENGCETGFVCAPDGECRGSSVRGPAVVSTDPPPSSVEGDGDQIRITFNQPMQAPSAATLRVRSAAFGALSGQYEASGPEVTFTPARVPRAGDQVEVSVRSTLESLGGMRLANPFVFRFRVESQESSGVLTEVARVEDDGVISNRVIPADLDGDGRFEILAHRGFELTVFRLTSDGRLQPEDEDFGSELSDIAVADFDQDGALDVFGASFEPGRSAPFFRRNGTLERCCVVTGLDFGVDRIETADMDGDGIPDLLGVIRRRDQTDERAAFVAINAGNGRFAVRVLDSTAAAELRTTDIAAEDMNGDGLLDVVLLNDQITRGPGSITVLLADGGGGYRRAAAPAPTQQVVDSFTTGDFDGDGDADVAVGQRVAGIITVYVNDGRGQLQAGVTRPGNGDVVEAADMNGDGMLDIVVTGAQILENVGMGIDFTPVLGGDSAGGNALGFADLDGDGDVDVVGTTAGPGFQMVILRND